MVIYEQKPGKKKIWIKDKTGDTTKVRLYESKEHKCLGFNMGVFSTHFLFSDNLREIANYLDKQNKIK